MANNQQGKRSQSDLNAPQNKNSQQQSNQSSADAQHAGSTDKTRSIRSGLSGQASVPHSADVPLESLEKKMKNNANNGTGVNPPTDKSSDRQGSKSGRGQSRDTNVPS
jgi:hypothetical protein